MQARATYGANEEKKKKTKSAWIHSLLNQLFWDQVDEETQSEEEERERKRRGKLYDTSEKKLPEACTGDTKLFVKTYDTLEERKENEWTDVVIERMSQLDWARGRRFKDKIPTCSELESK